MVRRRNAQSVEHESGIKRLFGGAGLSNCCGMRGFQYRFRNPWLDFFSIDALRMHGTPAVVRLGAPHRRDGAVLEHGQAGTDLPNRGRLRAGSGRDLRPGWARSDRSDRGFQLGCESRFAKTARRLVESRIRTKAGGPTRGKGRTARNSSRTEEAGRAEETPRGNAGTSR